MLVYSKVHIHSLAEPLGRYNLTVTDSQPPDHNDIFFTMAPTRHIWTSVQTNHAICLEIHGVLSPRQIADKLNRAFGCTKDHRTVKHRLDGLAGRLSPSEAARREGGNVVHEEW